MWRCIKCILLYCRASDIIRICVHSVSFLAGIDICGKEAGRWCHPWVFTLERCWGRVHSRRKRYSSFFTISHSDSQLFTLHDFMTFSVWKVMRIIWCECSSVISEWDRSYSQCCKWFVFFKQPGGGNTNWMLSFCGGHYTHPGYWCFTVNIVEIRFVSLSG